MIQREPIRQNNILSKSYRVMAMILLISVLLSSCTNKNNATDIPLVELEASKGFWKSTFIKDVIGNTPVGYEKIAENNTAIFFFDKKNITFIVRNKKTGYDWKSDYIPPVDSGLNSSWIKNLKSLFVLNASNIALNNNVIASYPSANYNKNINVKSIENGVSLTYLINDINISLVINLKLDEYGLAFEVPKDGITEGVGINERLKEIKKETFSQIDEAIKAIDSIDKINGARELVKEDIKKFTSTILGVKKMMEPYESPKGIEYAVIQIEQLISDATSIISGGESSLGFVKKLKAKGYSKKDLAKCQSVVNKIMDSVNLSISWIGQLKKLKYGGVVSIDVLPFLGTASDKDQGYMLYPDGCGAIAKFGPNHPAYTTYFNRGIYSDKNINLDLEKERSKSGIQNTTLPVYGINLNNNALVAIAQKGQDDAEINYYPSGYQVNLYRIAFSFNYRRAVRATDTRSSVGQKVSNIIERDGNMRDCEVRYLFVDSDYSDYGEMATYTRNYLLESGFLAKSKNLTSSIPLALNVLMNIKEKNMFYDTNLTMTTFEQANNMLKNYKENGVENLIVNLLGWTQEGYLSYPSGSMPAKNIGGESKLKNLANYAKESNIKLYLSDNYIDANEKTGGFGYNQLAKEYNASQIATDAGTDFIFSPKESFYRYQNHVLPKISSLPISGISFEKMGSFIYYDFDKKNQVKRQETTNIWANMMKKSKDQFGGLAVSTGNLYTLRFADWVMDAPSSDTGYSFSSEAVPFLQMVIHGSISYTTEPFNLFYDKKIQKLQAIEYGAIPYYFLTYEDTLKLKNTNFNTIFSSVYLEYKDESEKIQKEFNEKIGEIHDKYLIRHEKISEEVIKTTYSDGTVIYINYQETPVKIKDIVVAAKDYFVIKGDK